MLILPVGMERGQRRSLSHSQLSELVKSHRCDRNIISALRPQQSFCTIHTATCPSRSATLVGKQGHGATILPVESGVLHQGVCVPILNDHLAAHAGEALWVVLELPGHLWAGGEKGGQTWGGNELALLLGWRVGWVRVF